MADPELSALRQTSLRRDRKVEAAVGILVLALIGGLALLLLRDGEPGLETRTRTERASLTLGVTSHPFSPNRACDVYVVPVDALSERVAVRIARTLSQRVPVRACATRSLQLDLSAFDRKREQLDGVVVADQLAQVFQQARGITSTTVVGITVHDMYSSSFADDAFDFGVAKRFPQKQGFAVVSTARMGSGEDRFTRLETMAMRYVGLLYFGLPESSSLTSALAPSIRSLEQLDVLEPQFSDPPPSTAELLAARKEFLSKK